MPHGRETERARISKLLEDALTERGSALVLLGPAGVGKTALLPVARDLEVDFRVLSALPRERWSAARLTGELEARTELVPRTEVWVHCGTGVRSAIAAGILHRAGCDVTHIDDSFANVAAARIEVRPNRPESGSSRSSPQMPPKGTS